MTKLLQSRELNCISVNFRRLRTSLFKGNKQHQHPWELEMQMMTVHPRPTASESPSQQETLVILMCTQVWETLIWKVRLSGSTKSFIFNSFGICNSHTLEVFKIQLFICTQFVRIDILKYPCGFQSLGSYSQKKGLASNHYDFFSYKTTVCGII